MFVCIMYNVSEVVGVDLIYIIIFVCKLVVGMLWIILVILFCLICCVFVECYFVMVKLFDFFIDICKIVFMVVFLWYYFLIFFIFDFYFIIKVEVLFCGRGIVLLCLYDFLRGMDVIIILFIIFFVMFLVLIIFIVCVNIVVVKILL